MMKERVSWFKKAIALVALAFTSALGLTAQADDVAQVTIGGVTTQYSDLAKALTAAKASGAVCELLGDVTLTGDWTPVGTADGGSSYPNAFKGTFNGNGHTISGLNVSGADQVGLIGFINYGVVSNLTITGATVTGTGTQVGVAAGGMFHGTISDVKVFDSTVSGSGKYVGAILGGSTGLVKGCVATGNTITGKDQVGGLMGYLASGSLLDCVATNVVTATEERAGGLVGKCNTDSEFFVERNLVGGSAYAPDFAGGAVAQIMGGGDYWAIKDNDIDVTLSEYDDGKAGTVFAAGPVAILRPDQADDDFCAAIPSNITGNWWTDKTSTANSYTFTGNNVSAEKNYTIYRGVAMIGSKAYKTLQAAISAVGEIEGKTATITMIADELMDRNQGVTVPSGYTITLDLNGQTITVNVNENGHSWAVQNWGDLTITDSAKGGKITNSKDEGVTAGDWSDYNYVSDIIDNDGTLTIESGIIENTFDGNICYAVDNNGANGSAPVFYMKGGTLKHAASTVVRLAPGSTGVSATISGGTIEGAYGIVLNANNKNAPIITLNVTDGTIKAKDCALYESTAGLPKVDDPDISQVNVSISGGAWGDGAVTSGEKLIDVSVLASEFITGGTYTEDVSSYCASGYELAYDAETGKYGVVESARTIEVTPATVQAALDAAKTGDTIVLGAGAYDKLYLRQTLANSTRRTDLDNGGSYPAYYRQFKDLTIKVADGADVTCKGIVAEAGLFWYSSCPASNQEAMGRATSGFLSYLELDNIVIDGIAFDTTDGNSCVVLRDNAASSDYCDILVDGLTIQNCTATGDVANTSLHFFSAGSGTNGKCFPGTEKTALNNLAIVDCTLTNFYQPICHNNASATVNGYTITGNTFNNCKNNLIQMSNGKAAGAWVIANNTTINQNGRFARITNAAADATFTVTNNTVTTPIAYDEDGSIFKVTGTAGFTVTEKDNDWTAGAVSGGTYISNGDTSLLPIAQVTISGVTTTYSDLHGALEAAVTGKGTCELIADVTLTSDWTPVAFSGATFNGNGKKISGLNNALFQKVTSATVSNLTITANISASCNDIGIVTCSSGTGTLISDVKVIDSTLVTTGERVGGICGTGYPKIYDCVVSNCTITGAEQVGGIQGYTPYPVIKGCAVVGTTTLTATDTRAGGLVGKFQVASGEGSGMRYLSDNVVSCTVSSPKLAGGLCGQIMGDLSTYEVKNNDINVTYAGNPTATTPLGTIRPIADGGVTTTFTEAIGANVTGNWWEDATLNADSYTYSAEVTGGEAQTIYRGVAAIGETCYKTLAAAIAAVGEIEGKTATITMIANELMDRNQGVTVPSDCTITLDLNGQTITVNVKENDHSWAIQNWGNLTITDSTTGGKITNSKDDGVQPGDPANGYGWCSNIIDNDGVLTIESGILENALTGSACYAVDNCGANGSTPVFYMKGGTLKHSGYSVVRLGPGSTGVTAEISDGTIEGAYGIVINPMGQTEPKVSLTVSGGTIKANNCALYESSVSGVTDTSNVSISISGGIWGDGVPEDDLVYIVKLGSKFITGGTYTEDVTTYCADGYEVKYDSETGKYGVVESTPVAQVTVGGVTTTYSDLNAALEAATGSGAVCELLGDVALTGDWTPVAFSGATFNGNGHTVSGLTVEGAGYVGLFKTLSNATVKDLTISGATVTSTGDKAGILAAEVSSGTITNVTVTASTVSSTGEYVGGLFGIGYSSVKGCTVTGSTISGKEQVGGAIGYMWVGHIENCTVTGNTVTAEDRAGGLIGKAQFAKSNMGNSTMWINGNTVSGTAKAPGKSVGGLCGQIMGDCDWFEIKNNEIDVALDGATQNPIGNLRDKQNAAFTGALSANITGNWWEDATLDAAYFDYTNVAEGVADQRIYRGVAQIGSKAYKTLAAAVAAAQDGDTVTLVRDASGDGIQVASGKNFTLDFGGFTYTVDGELTGSEGTKTQGFQLLKDSTIVFTNGTITSSKAKYLIQNYANLTLTGMTLDGANLADTSKTAYTLSTNNGKTEIVNSTIIARSENGIAFDCCCWSPYTDNVVTLTSGTITGDIEVSSYDDRTPSLKLNGGTISGALVMGDDADKVTVTKADAVQLDAPTGYKWDANGKLVSVTYVAQIGDEKYESLAAAIAAVGEIEGKTATITMIADELMDRNQGVTVPSGCTITLDLNGQTITVNVKENDHSWAIQNWGNLTITDSATGGKITNSKDEGVQPGDPANGYGWCSNIIDNDGVLTIDGGILENALTGSACYAVDNCGANGSTPVFYMKGGTLKHSGYSVIRLGPGSTGVTAEISGGTIEGTFGIVINPMGQTEPKVSLTVSGGTIKANCYALYESSVSGVTDTSDVSISISGGVWGDGTPAADLVVISKLASKFITGGTYTQDVSAYAATGFQVNKVTIDEVDCWVVGEVVDTGNDTTAVVIIDEQTASVDTNATAAVVTDPEVAEKVVQNTVVTGVKLVASNETHAVSGAQSVVNVAKETGTDEFAANLEKGTNVIIQVDVEVKPTVYVAPSAGEEKEGEIKFNLQPVATVTIDEGGENKTNKVDVTNEMLDLLQDIVVTVYTGFKPALAVHTDKNGETIETFGSNSIQYEEVTGNATIIISHFSDVTFFEASTDAVVTNCTDKDGIEKDVTIPQAWLVANNLTVADATSKTNTVNGLPVWKSYVLGQDPAATVAYNALKVLPQDDGTIDVEMYGFDASGVNTELVTVSYACSADTEVNGSFATKLESTTTTFEEVQDAGGKRFYKNATVDFTWK